MSLSSTRSMLPSATPLLIRHFTSTASTSAGRGNAPSEAVQAQRRKGEIIQGQNHLPTLKPFEFNDTTTFGYLRLAAMREAHELVEKITGNDAALKRHHRPFVPPKSPIRVTQTINLNEPEDPVMHKRSILIPVSQLPLGTPEERHRIKLIAGPRWTPGKPGSSEEGKVELRNKGYNAGPKDIGKEGWIKISDDRFSDGRMNRKSASDMLDRLIIAAKDKSSPLTMEIPIDTRHIIARERRRKRLDRTTHAQALELEKRPGSVGCVKGYPKEWLGDEVKVKALQGKARLSDFKLII